MILTYSNSAPTLGIAARDADEVIKGNIKKLYEDVYPNYSVYNICLCLSKSIICESCCYFDP